MKRKDIPRFIAAIAHLRETAPDETALESVFAFPEWKADGEYKKDDRIRYGEDLYRCVQPHFANSTWCPDLVPALWAKISLDEFPEWVQPLGAEDAYQHGDKVTHDGFHYVSTFDGANVWEPGVYGWEVTK